MTYALTPGNFLLLLLRLLLRSPLGLKDRSLAVRWDLGLKVGIWTSRLGFGPQGWDMGFEAEIWAWRWGGYGEGGGEGENSLV